MNNLEKTQMNLHLLLPEVPDEKDACVQRMIEQMEARRGIEKVHVVSKGNGEKAQLCFHYDPREILMTDVEQLAAESGAMITGKYGHLLLEVKGVRHPRHARILESELANVDGILSVSVSGNGFIQLEFDRDLITAGAVKKKIEDIGLRIVTVHDVEPAGSAHPGVRRESREHADEGEKEHSDHTHGTWFGERTELYFSLFSGLMLGAGFGLSFVENIDTWIPISFYVLAYLSGGFFTTQEAVSGISQGRFQIDFLMIVAAIGAAFLGRWAEGALLLFLFSLGHSLEHYALGKAKKSITALAGLYPKTALVKMGDELREVLVERLLIGQTMVVRPNSIIGADGIVVDGTSSVNQAPITGESVPVEKTAFAGDLLKVKDFSTIDQQHRVFAGTINGNETVEVYVSNLTKDSTLSRLIRMVKEAQTQKSDTQNFTDRIEKYYVPIVLALVTVLLFAFTVRDEPFSASFYRAMAVLIAASPCALAISTPSAVLSGVARAARGGVLIKGGKPLEELGAVRAMAFDKTGTLTMGKPELTGVYPVHPDDMEEFLEMVVAVEKLSDHPLAAAIVKGGEEELDREVTPASNLRAIVARGIQAEYNQKTVHIGNLALFEESNIYVDEAARARVLELERAGNTTMLVSRDNTFEGIITLMDLPRKEAADALRRIRQREIRHMVMLTGDNQEVANSVAEMTGITDARGGLLPEQKVAAIDEMKRKYGKVAMVGDGVNDAPAMARSNVGIAMGAAGSPLALETADVALMADSLANLPFAIGLSRQSRRVIRQNLVISIGMVLILIPLTIGGLSIAPAVIGHEGSTMVVVLNALRLLGYKKD